MVLIISAQKPEIDSPIEKRFGRCPWLIWLDTETNQWKALPNPGASKSGGAGVAAAQFVIDQQVSVVISGDFGPNTARAFQAANIEMYLFNNDIFMVQQAIDCFKQGKLPVFK